MKEPLFLGPFGESIQFKKKLSKAFLKQKDTFFFVDECFKKAKGFEACENILFLKAGEGLKTFKQLEKNLNWLIKKGASKKSRIVAVGGGSIGDSVGFLASIYMRGVLCTQVPTTWLAAVDSAVGGKTALNFSGYKNQVGTVDAPEKIMFIEELLKTSKIEESEGEILKTFILNLSKSWGKSALKSWSRAVLSREDLIRLVSYKTQVVKRDKKDAKGIRAVLNLGHSMGHVFEAHLGLSHSAAVKYGLRFACVWSYRKKLLSEKKFDLCMKSLPLDLPKVNLGTVTKALLRDKKLTNKRKINFIFPTNKGALVSLVSVESIVKEYDRQVKSGF